MLGIDAVERERKTVRIAFAADLAVADDIDAGPFHLADRDDRGVVLRLFAPRLRNAPDVAGMDARHAVMFEKGAIDQPVGLRIAADDRGRDQMGRIGHCGAPAVAAAGRAVPSLRAAIALGPDRLPPPAVVEIPGDRLAQPGLESMARLPAQFAADFRRHRSHSGGRGRAGRRQRRSASRAADAANSAASRRAARRSRSRHRDWCARRRRRHCSSRRGGPASARHEARGHDPRHAASRAHCRPCRRPGSPRRAAPSGSRAGSAFRGNDRGRNCSSSCSGRSAGRRSRARRAPDGPRRLSRRHRENSAGSGCLR